MSQNLFLHEHHVAPHFLPQDTGPPLLTGTLYGSTYSTARKPSLILPAWTPRGFHILCSRKTGHHLFLYGSHIGIMADMCVSLAYTETNQSVFQVLASPITSLSFRCNNHTVQFLANDPKKHAERLECPWRKQ